MRKDIDFGISKRGIWKYNQIIGYIRITFKEGSFWFDLYVPDYESKIYKFSRKRNFVSLHQPNGMHFSIDQDDKTNRKLMETHLKGCIRVLPKRWYVDTKQFKAVNLLIDYSKLKQ